MLYDDHRKLGFEHAKMGMPRYRWSDPYLQVAYDEGYNLRGELEAMTDERRRIAGLPGMTTKKHWRA